MKKIVLLLIGFILLGFGIFGIILPVLPTVPFFLGASFCFLKSSERLNAWFCKTGIYKNYVEPFEKQKGLTLKVKLLILIPVGILLTALFILLDNLILRIIIATLLIVKIIVFIKIKTIPDKK